MKCLKKLTAIIAAFALLSSTAVNAATVLVNEGKIDTRTEALKTNMSRVGSKDGYNPTWPGKHGGLHYVEITAPLAYDGAYSLETVFGSECDDLLYTDYDSVSSVNAMLLDEGTYLATTDIAEYNGYIFALCNGRKPVLIEDKEEYFQYGNGKIIVYDALSRSGEGYDSYLYVFDISRAENYKDALVAKWHMTDLGLEEYSYAPNRIMSNISIDDDYIYITLNNQGISASVGNAAEQYDRFLAVFKNNISRENPDYITNTDILKPPQRAENPETVATYPYGAKQIYDHSEIGENIGNTLTTKVINGTQVMWFETSRSMAATSSKQDSMVYITEVETSGDYAEVKDTKIHYGLEKYLEMEKATTAPLTSVLQYKPGVSWIETINPVLNSIINDGNLMYILVSYSLSENDAVNSYHRIYVTDWSNPATPKNITMFEWKDEKYSEVMSEGTTLTIADNLHYYDGYFYIAGTYGITILKAKDDTGEYNTSYVSYIPYSSETTGVVNKPVIVAVGNYLILWDDIGGINTWHWAAEAKLLLEEDKSAVKELGSHCIYARKHHGVFANSIETYGNRIYVPAPLHPLGFALTGMVEVINFEETAPLELSVEPTGDIVTVPYTIKGKSFGLNAVQLTVNGEEFYLETTAGEGNYKVWEYEITEPGHYEIDAVGAILKGYPNEATAEHLSFTATVGGEVEYGGTIKTDLLEDHSSVVTVSPYLRNNNFSGAVMVVPSVGIYYGNTMITMAEGEPVAITPGEDVTFEDIVVTVPSDYVKYSVKLFLLSDGEIVAPLVPSVTLKGE